MFPSTPSPLASSDLAGADRPHPLHPHPVGVARSGQETCAHIQLWDLTYPPRYVRSSLLDVYRWIVHAVSHLPDLGYQQFTRRLLIPVIYFLVGSFVKPPADRRIMNILGRWRLRWPSRDPADRVLALASVYEHPGATLRDIAGEMNITERRALNALRQLQSEGWVDKVREGRVGRYTANLSSADVRAILSGE